MYISVDSSFKSKKPSDIVFKLNSDDFSSHSIRKITKYVKDVLKLNISKTRTYSDVKLMSWCNVKIQSNVIVSWDKNDEYALDIINAALFPKEYSELEKNKQINDWFGDHNCL